MTFVVDVPLKIGTLAHKMTSIWDKNGKIRDLRYVKTILWVLFFRAWNLPPPPPQAFPGAIGRFARHRAILPLKKGKRMGREKTGNPCKQRLWRRLGLPGAGGRGEGRGRRGPEERAMRVPQGKNSGCKSRRQRGGRLLSVIYVLFCERMCLF